MTTLEIEALANRGNAAKADFNIKSTLRNLAIPRFLLDVDDQVGQVHWRRKVLSLDMLAGEQSKDLPSDFDRFDEVRLYTSEEELSDPLEYIGEVPEKVLAAETSSEQGRAAGYYIVDGSEAPYALKLSAPLEKARSVKAIYFRGIPFTDDTTEVDLNPYIPSKYQAALVHRLRAEIFLDRYGIRDDRHSEEERRYREFIQSMASRKEPAPRNRAVFAR